MRMSEAKKLEVYAAIHEQVMLKRVAVRNSVKVLGRKNTDDIDLLLWNLDQNIWSAVEKALNIEKSK